MTARILPYLREVLESEPAAAAMSLAGKSLGIRFGRGRKRVIKFYAFGTVASIGGLDWNHDVRAVVAQEPMPIGPCRHALELLTFHAVWALDAFNYMHRSRPSPREFGRTSAL